MPDTDRNGDAPGAPSLAARVAALLDPLGGRTSFAAQRLPSASRGPLPVRTSASSPAVHTERRDEAASVVLRPDDVFPAASLAKIPIALELLRRADMGQFDLTERLDTSSEPRVGGGGVLDYLDPATLLTLDDFCFLMIGVSDNTAANFLLDLVGMGEVNETMNRLNLTHTRLARRFMDFAARAAHRENLTSAADMASLLSLLRGSALPGAARLRDLLAAQQLDEDLKARLPEAARLAHKTGALDGIFHDAGILTGPASACVYCVLTADQPDVPAARFAIAQILRALWDEWCDHDTQERGEPPPDATEV